MSAAEWIPLYWPASWRDTSLLSLLEGSPVNCLLLEQANPELQAAITSKGLTCIPPGDARVSWKALKEVDWRTSEPLVCVGDAFWPDLAQKGASGSVDAGPTGAPWLDANGWIVQLARTRGQGKTVWIKSDPPENLANLTAESFQLCVTEAAAYGARRPAWITPSFAEQVAAKQERAVAGWKKLMDTIAWVETRRARMGWPVMASMAVISDYSGANEYLSTEVLNLSARQGFSVSPVETGKLRSDDLKSRKGALYLDDAPPPDSALTVLQRFVESGGLLVCTRTAAEKLKGLRAPVPANVDRFAIAACGKGRVAVAKDGFDDPWILADDAHTLLSRRFDPVRLFNGGSLTWHATQSSDGKRSLVHLLNYTKRPSWNTVSLMPTFPITGASVHILGEAEPKRLELQREAGNREVYIPRFPIYAAVELEVTHGA
jgi:hypothetical protein